MHAEFLTLISISGQAITGIMEWTVVYQFQFLLFIDPEIVIVLTVIKCFIIINAEIMGFK